ncbi:MAG: fasciclin domain-containing protein [Anaerolineales bacterium]|nr:fasciclin domain-containing protein [Anaerolineales bacterium]
MMNKSKWQRLVVASLMLALLTATFAPAAMAASEAAPVAQTAKAESPVVTGTIPGGQFAKIWLGLTPINPGTVTVTAEWDRQDALASGLGFFILSPENLSAVSSGAPLSANNVGAGSEKFFLNGPSNVQGANFRATGTDYTIVVYNDSQADANFTLTAENGLIEDDSDQVSIPGAEATDEAAAPTEAAATEEATAAATPAAAVAVTGTTAAAATPAATAAAAPVTTVAPGPVTGQEFTGTLPNQYDQHILALAPTNRDGEVTLTLAFDPQDSTELARRINFWVMDQEAFKRYLAGDAPSAVAVAAGSRESGNTRATTFKTTGFGPYSVIVYNNSRVPAEYSLRVDGGILEDDSNQTVTAQLANGGASTAATTDAAAAPAAVAATTATTATTGATAATTTSSGVEGEKGGQYTVKAGDTLAIIARDIYGNFELYEQLCAFNNIADCNVIEVGQVINLPTDAQIGATGTTAAATPAATAVATTVATPAATAAVTSTAAVTTTPVVRPTTAVTPTTAITPTTPTTPTTAPTTGGATGTVVDDLTAAGNFTTLLAALKAAGLDTALEGSGPFTVFAPTDAAFDAFLSSNNLTEDLLLRAKELPGVLQYHVLSGKVLAADITNGSKATTLQGKPVTFEVKDGKVYVNGAQVVTADMSATNGVIHVIDTVILPPQQ